MTTRLVRTAISHNDISFHFKDCIFSGICCLKHYMFQGNDLLTVPPLRRKKALAIYAKASFSGNIQFCEEKRNRIILFFNVYRVRVVKKAWYKPVFLDKPKRERVNPLSF